MLERVRLPRARFAPELLEELFGETTSTVHEDGDDLIFDHMYIERRMVPLNLYLRDAPPEAAARVAATDGVRAVYPDEIFRPDAATPADHLGLAEAGGAWESLGGADAAGTGIVVGGVVVAPRASELLYPLAIAVSQRLTVHRRPRGHRVRH